MQAHLDFHTEILRSFQPFAAARTVQASLHELHTPILPKAASRKDFVRSACKCPRLAAIISGRQFPNNGWTHAEPHSCLSRSPDAGIPAFRPSPVDRRADLAPLLCGGGGHYRWSGNAWLSGASKSRPAGDCRRPALAALARARFDALRSEDYHAGPR